MYAIVQLKCQVHLLHFLEHILTTATDIKLNALKKIGYRHKKSHNNRLGNEDNIRPAAATAS